LQQENQQLREDLSYLIEDISKMNGKVAEQLHQNQRNLEISVQTIRSKYDRSVCVEEYQCENIYQVKLPVVLGREKNS
jgi:hypothetical protein